MKVMEKQNGKYQILSEINMIPFIDVALVLLIIFMVMTPFLVKAQIKLSLPTSQSTDVSVDDKAKTIDVQVRKDGVYFIEGKRVSADSLQEVIGNKVVNPEHQSLVIEADKDVVFQKVVDVMGIAKKLNVSKIGVRVIEEGKSTSKRP